VIPWAFRRRVVQLRQNASLLNKDAPNKDAPIFRPIQQTGIIRSHPILGGLHHHYVRV